MYIAMVYKNSKFHFHYIAKIHLKGEAGDRIYETRPRKPYSYTFTEADRHVHGLHFNRVMWQYPVSQSLLGIPNGVTDRI